LSTEAEPVGTCEQLSLARGPGSDHSQLGAFGDSYGPTETFL